MCKNIHGYTVEPFSSDILFTQKFKPQIFLNPIFQSTVWYCTRAWTETLELHALKWLSAYQLKCTCVGLHTVSLHVSLQTTARITGEQRWTQGPVHF